MAASNTTLILPSFAIIIYILYCWYPSGIAAKAEEGNTPPHVPMRDSDTSDIDTEHCRLVAMGDIHGGLENAQKGLLKAKVIGHNSDGGGVGNKVPGSMGLGSSSRHYHWSMGCGTLIQTGDIVDRGPTALEALEFFRVLGEEAKAAGGRVIRLLGNHELLLLNGDGQYVNPDEMRIAGGSESYMQPFAPGGKWRKEMQQFSVAAMAQNTVFVHGGLLPSHAAVGIKYLNKLAQIQIANNQLDGGLFGDEGPLMTRKVIGDAVANECGEIEMSLSLLGARRMVIGHTVQPNNRVVSYCGGKLVAIDVGMSEAIAGYRAACVEFVKGGHMRVFYAEIRAE